MGLAVIVGAGSGLSASLARKLKQRGHKIVLASRDPGKLAGLAEETEAVCVACDARQDTDMTRLFSQLDSLDAPIDVAVYNCSDRVSGPVEAVDPAAVENAMMVTAYGAFLMAHHAVQRMLACNSGALMFTGASAGVKGFPNSSSFAMGKFALRGLCQSLARELHPKGIHVGHFVLDGGISKTPDHNDDARLMDPAAIADTYMQFLDQPPSVWAWEIELRPWVERF